LGGKVLKGDNNRGEGHQRKGQARGADGFKLSLSLNMKGGGGHPPVVWGDSDVNEKRVSG